MISCMCLAGLPRLPRPCREPRNQRHLIYYRNQRRPIYYYERSLIYCRDQRHPIYCRCLWLPARYKRAGYVSVHMSIHMSIHMSTHMSIHLSIHMPVHTSLHLSVHTSIHIPPAHVSIPELYTPVCARV